jgi:hypothetical protein
MSGVAPVEARFDNANFVIDLTDRHAEVVACSSLEIDGQPAPLCPKIFEGVSVT